jgi:hypothetical protein
MEMIKTPLMGLVRDLKDQIQRFIRQEFQLVKTELSEKVAYFGRNGMTIGIGGFIAYAGSIVLLLGLGFLVAWAFTLAGLSPLFAAFLGLTSIGLLAGGIGAAMVMKGIHAFSRETLTPQRTLYTLQELKSRPAEVGAPPVVGPASPPGISESAELQKQVEKTESSLGETVSALEDRVNPKKIAKRVNRRIHNAPYISGLVAVAAGLASGFLIRLRLRRAA